MNQKRMAATRKTIAVARADAGAAEAPWPCAFGATAGGFAAGLGGAAESLGAGGGQVTVPSLMTVVPRITSSSMLTLMGQAFCLQSSSASSRRFAAESGV